ncbi:hypothetical protein B0J18DRAFT_433861 [Chaetomium sp. MPI-SDFR-AT-0129]|nr:hypothetical protein B0J18DRAFT_433861 [Chaetomium sp. MPI-SDFR-AT-0129]
MAPAASRDLHPSCCGSPSSSPSSLFRIDMHTHIMPPSLPDFASFFPSSSNTTDNAYPWPNFRPSASSIIATPPKQPSQADKEDQDADENDGAIDMYIGPQFFRRVTRSCYSPAARLRDMDAAGVDVQVLSTVPVLFCYDAPVDTPPQRAAVRALVRGLNDHVAGVCAEMPERFVGLGTVGLQDFARVSSDASGEGEGASAPGQEAVAELRRVMGMPGMVGVQIGTSVELGGRDGGVMMLDDERLEPFWTACEELDAAVFVHPLGYALTRENPARWGKYWGSWLVGMPSETALAMHVVMSSGLLVRHPRLRLCFAHGGGAFPALLGRIQHGFNCRPDLVATKACGITPTEHFGGQHRESPSPSRSPGSPTSDASSQRQIWIDSLMHDPDLLEYVLRKLGPRGADRIVLGSDYPFPLGEVPVAGKMLTEDERLGRFMSWRERAGVLSLNAIRFLKLGREFEDKFQERWQQFEAANGISSSSGKQVTDAAWDGWRHRDSAIDLDEDGGVRKGRGSGERSPGSVGSL